MAKKISCLLPEQQTAYDALTVKQRRYVDFRSLGYGKKDSYIRAGFRATKNANKAAYSLEKNNLSVSDLIQTMTQDRLKHEVYNPESKASEIVNAIAEQQDNRGVARTLENLDPEMAKQLKFYRDIADGKIKTRKKTTMYEASGIVKSVKIEEVSDINSRVAARKELDRILGINKPVEIGSIQMGDITVNIVDASKKELDNADKIEIEPIEVKNEEENVIEIDDLKEFKTENKLRSTSKPKNNKFKREIISGE